MITSSRPLSKEELRSFMRHETASRDASWAFLQSKRITEALCEQDAVRLAKRVGIYMAKPVEVQTKDIISRCWKAGCDVCIPAFHQEQSHYAWAAYESDTPIAAGRQGIDEPVSPKWVEEPLDTVLVPGMAFDEAGHRLGYGGGHFDRLLAASEAVHIGLAFDFQLLASLPMEEHDVRMDIIVTPTRLLTPS